MADDKWKKWAIELQSLTQAGLFYLSQAGILTEKDLYDKERYERIREISAEMMAEGTGIPVEKVKNLFCNDVGYQTPKIDTRAAVFQDDKILLVHEANGTWSMPGGWCEVTLSPVENTIKEAKEEAGRDIKVTSVISVQNRDNHNFPPYAYGVVKIFYLCEEIGGSFIANTETTEAEYFSEDNLPKLAPEKCNEEQVKMCFDAYRAKNWKTQFD